VLLASTLARAEVEPARPQAEAGAANDPLPKGVRDRLSALPPRPGGVIPLHFTPDGNGVLLDEGGQLRLWDATTGKPLPLPETLAKYHGRPLSFGAAGQVLLTNHGKVVALWDWPAGRLRQEITLTDRRALPEEVACREASLSPDGRVLAVRTERRWKELRGAKILRWVDLLATELWDATSGKRLQRLDLDGMYSPAPLFAADGRLLLLSRVGPPLNEGAEPSEVLSVWSVEPLRMRRAFASPRPDPDGKRRVRHVALSPDGRTLAAAEDDGSVTLFEYATGGVRRRLTDRRAGAALIFTPDGRRLVTTGKGGTVSSWDMSLAAAPTDTPTARPDDSAWADLAGSEAGPTYQAMACLAADPRAAVALLKERLRPVTTPDEAALDRLVADLDGKTFAVRRRASEELDRFGGAVLPGVLARLSGAKSLELRRRLEQFLRKHDRDVVSSERLREGRALELLEHLGTAAARAVLRELAGGSPCVRLTQDAAASLRRLERLTK
jgi:hypothetical protein